MISACGTFIFRNGTRNCGRQVIRCKIDEETWIKITRRLREAGRAHLKRELACWWEHGSRHSRWFVPRTVLSTSGGCMGPARHSPKIMRSRDFWLSMWFVCRKLASASLTMYSLQMQQRSSSLTSLWRDAVGKISLKRWNPTNVSQVPPVNHARAVSVYAPIHLTIFKSQVGPCNRSFTDSAAVILPDF